MRSRIVLPSSHRLLAASTTGYSSLHGAIITRSARVEHAAKTKRLRLIGGNDNIIGRIGEFIALQFLEKLGQKPIRVTDNANPGYDFVDGDTQTQVKVITEENQKGRNVRLTEPWTQFVLIELGQQYRPIRIGIISKSQLQLACAENAGWSATPIVKRTMLGARGLIRRYGRVFEGPELHV